MSQPVELCHGVIFVLAADQLLIIIKAVCHLKSRQGRLVQLEVAPALSMEAVLLQVEDARLQVVQVSFFILLQTACFYRIVVILILKKFQSKNKTIELLYLQQ